jgi:hypothetical protein
MLPYLDVGSAIPTGLAAHDSFLELAAATKNLENIETDLEAL